jgi:hypothetical protein
MTLTEGEWAERYEDPRLEAVAAAQPVAKPAVRRLSGQLYGQMDVWECIEQAQKEEHERETA